MRWLLILLLIPLNLLGQTRISVSPIRVVQTLADLDNLPPSVDAPVVRVMGFVSPKDWGELGREFYYDRTNTLATNAIRRAVRGGVGRWVHDWDGNAGTFGALPGTDISLALSNALVVANGKRVWLPKAEYLSAGLVYTNGPVWIDGQGSTIKQSLDGYGWNFRSESIFETTVSSVATNLVDLHTDGLSTKATRVLSATLSTNVSLSRGDLVFLYSNDRIPGGHSYSATSAGRIGEWFTVGQSVTNTNVVHFSRMPVEDYQTLIRIAVPNQTNRITVENLVFDEKDDTDPTSSGRTGFISATGYIHPDFKNIEIVRAYGGACVFRCCYGGTMDRIVGRRLNNLSAYNQFGYLVNDRGSFGCSYSNLRGTVFRHMNATTASGIEDGDSSAAWYNHGTSMFGIVRDSIGMAGSNSPFETHENSYGWSLVNLHSIGSFDGNNAGGPGLVIRGRGHTVRNVLIENCNVGLFLWAGYSNDVRNIQIDNVTVRGAVDGAIQIYAGGSGPAYLIDNVTIRNSYFHQKGSPGLAPASFGVYCLSVSNLVAQNCTFHLEAPSNGGVLLASAAADRGPTVSRWENCTWIIDPGSLRPFDIQAGRHEFLNNKFIMQATVPSSLELMKIGPDYGTNAVVVLKDCEFDVRANTSNPNLLTVDTESDVLVGENISIITGGNADAVGWVWNAIGASSYSPRIEFTNVVCDVAIGSTTDSLFDTTNIRTDFTDPASSSKHVSFSATGQIKWPASIVRLSTLSADATLYLPKAGNYPAGSKLSLLNVGSTGYKWTVRTNSLFATDQINGSPTTTLEMDIPGEMTELVSDGISSWTTVSPRSRTVRDATGSTSFFTFVDGYSVTANANPTIITLPSALNYQSARQLYGTKVGGAYQVHFVPTSGQTINGSTNALVLADTGDAVIFKADPKGTTRTNWIVVGSHGLP